MRLQGLGTRWRPCASRLNTHAEAPCFKAGAPAVCWVLEEATTDRAPPPAGMEGDYLCLESIHSDAYIHFFAFIDSVKNHPASFWFSDMSSSPVWRARCRPFFSIRREKNNEIFLRMDIKHWKVTIPTTDKINRDRSDCQISTKLSHYDCFWLLLFYIAAVYCVSLYSTFDEFVTRRAASSYWSTRIGPPEVQRSCRATIGKLAAL